MLKTSEQPNGATIRPPACDSYLWPPSLLRVELDDDEEIAWQWTHFLDGRSAVTGYRIVNYSQALRRLLEREIPMTKTNLPVVLDLQDIERRIVVVRGQRVMLDSELGRLYGVPTKALNQAVARNADRFPEDFAYQLTGQEFVELKSQSVTSKAGRGGKQKLPWVFTEHGVAMLSSVLRSPRAVQVNIAIMRAFVRMRRLLATPGELVAQLNQLADSVQLHEEQIKTIADVLRRMMQPPPEPPKRKIGFRPEMQLPGNGQVRGNPK